MSRRGRNGRHQQPHPGTRAARPASAVDSPGTSVPVAFVAPEPAPAASAPVVAAPVAPPSRPVAPVPPPVRTEELAPAAQAVVAIADARPVVDGGTTCTTAQLRRFIKSRPWVPMHELRRRFGIWGGDDDVSSMRVAEHTLFIGLPIAESRMVAELLAGGDVGYELSLDPTTPVVVGVYPMRPVPRG